MKNKTFTTWLTLLLGAFGLHRFYLYGSRDAIAWMMPIPTALGVYGFERVAEYGLDDVLSWWLLPLLGFHLAAVCLTAIVYGLMPQERWNLRFNPEADAEAKAGATSWTTVFAVIISLMLGTVFLLSAFAYAFQRYFEVTV